ncbi:MAG: DUF523 domain-containing protein, partial [Candidatus Gracilibacteria bacterium]|nr:DUF523 domain-containing protein [Candidatus Gracilibacteria bacterium]
MILVSACLAGINCRYDGKSQVLQEIIDLVKNGKAIPVCPELLAGLGVPRLRSEKRGTNIITETGEDVTQNFLEGALEALEIAKD